MKETKWFLNLKSKYSSGISNIFCLTGNIGDYAVPGSLFLDYLIKSLREILHMDNVGTFDSATGLTWHESNGQPNHTGQGLVDVIEILETSIRNDNLENQNIISKNAIIIRYPEYLIPNVESIYSNDSINNNLINLHKLISSKLFLNSDNIIIFLTESASSLNKMFFSSNARTNIIKVEYPDEKERFEFIKELFDRSQDNVDLDMRQFAKLTSGLNRVNIEDIFLLCESKKNKKVDKHMIIERKKEFIQKEFQEIIQIFDVEGYSLSKFAGQEKIKDYHKEVVIEPITTGETAIVPKGLLYVGPPGTGKTYFAKCLAGDAGINFIEFKLSKILNKYVGESEKNLEKAFNCFESLAPVGVFIDEIDQVLGRGDDDNTGVRSAIFGAFLSFLSKESNRGRILFIGATNYPNKIDEALKRPGRFDKKIPFLCPDEEERKNVFEIHLKKTGLKCEELNYSYLAQITDGYTQAEIENIVLKALELTKRKKLTIIKQEVIQEAIDCVVARKSGATTEMIEIALKECDDLEFLPSKYVEKIKAWNKK